MKLTLLSLFLLLPVAAGCTEDDPLNTGGDAGQPVQVCSAGEKRCLGDRMKVCATDGLSWLVTDCVAQGQRCLLFTGVPQCTPKLCVPGLPSCADDGLTTRTCAQDGMSWTKGKKCDLAKGELCYSGACDNACQHEAKDQQSVGCAFYPVNLQNESVDVMGVVVSNPTLAATTVKLFSGTALMQTKNLAAGKLATFLIPAGKGMIKGTGKSKVAFKLTSTLPVAAYQFSPLNKAEQRSNDASLLIPATSLGKRHRLISAKVTRAGSASILAVVGTVAGTKVTITPSADTAAGGGVAAGKTGKAFSVTLGPQDLLQVAATALNADLTGTLVSSDKPVAVFGGHTCANLPKGKTYCDHIQEQMFPVETWGTGYLAAKFMPRGEFPEHDWWRVVASEASTVITLEGAPELGSSFTLAAGEYYQFSTSRAFVIKGDKPFTLGHYSLGEQEVTPPADKATYTEGFQTIKGCTQDVGHTNLGDPALAVSVPWAQYRSNYAFLVPDTYRYDFVTLLFPAGVVGPDVVLDGKVQDLTFRKVGATGLSYARMRITDGPHQIKASHQFGIEVHGYDCNVSYAYSGGNNLKPINPIK